MHPYSVLGISIVIAMVIGGFFFYLTFYNPTEQVKNLENDITGLDKEIEKSGDTITDLNAKITEKESDIVDLNESIKEKDEDIAKKDEDIAKKDEDIAEMSPKVERIPELETEITILKQAKVDLEDDKKDLEVEREELKGDLEEANEEIIELESTIAGDSSDTGESGSSDTGESGSSDTGESGDVSLLAKIEKLESTITELKKKPTFYDEKYISKKDSPFLNSINNGSVFLEDFEDRNLTDKVSLNEELSFGSDKEGSAEIYRAKSAVDSMPEDVQEGETGTTLYLGSLNNHVIFTFETRELPTQAGFVVTQVPDKQNKDDIYFIFWIEDSEGNIIHSKGPQNHDLRENLDYDNNQFFGVEYEKGIKSMGIVTTGDSMEIDHLQFTNVQ